jgi:GT2 family glycosyltransferase
MAGQHDLLPPTDRGPLPAPTWERIGAANPRVTVGIPAYNRPKLLAEALANLARQENFTEFEVVISDDGGLAETRALVEASGIASIRYYVNRPALGPVQNWNRCIELARAPWVTILHEDDCLYPWFFQTVVPELRQDRAAVSVRCVQGPEIPPLAAEPGRRGERYEPLWFLKASMTPFPGVVFRRDLAAQLGGFDVRQEGLADYAFWYALATHGGIVHLPAAAAFYRVNEGQWTDRAWPSMLRGAHLLRLRIAREQLPRRKALGRWLARFYTARMARAYARRFAERPAILRRAQTFERIPLSWVSSGWVWALLRRLRPDAPAGRK